MKLVVTDLDEHVDKTDMIHDRIEQLISVATTRATQSADTDTAAEPMMDSTAMEVQSVGSGVLSPSSIDASRGCMCFD